MTEEPLTEAQMEGAIPCRVWFVSWTQGFGMLVEGQPAVGADWLATVYRLRNGHIYIEYRFRYYRQGGYDAFDQRDVKNWTSLLSQDTGPEAETRAIEACRMLFGINQMRGSVAVAEEVPVENGDIIAALKGRSWVHLRTAVDVD